MGREKIDETVWNLEENVTQGRKRKFFLMLYTKKIDEHELNKSSHPLTKKITKKEKEMRKKREEKSKK